MTAVPFQVHPALTGRLLEPPADPAAALLEGVKNALDAGAGQIEIQLSEQWLAISDNGRGLGPRARLEQGFGTLGRPPQRGQWGAVHGRWGLGRLRLLALGPTRWTSGPFIIETDLSRRGLAWELHERCPPGRAGCMVQVRLEHALAARELEAAAHELERAVRHAPARIRLNGRPLTLSPGQGRWDWVSAEAFVRLRGEGPLAIYNMGVLAARWGGWVSGAGGEVLSRRPLLLEPDGSLSPRCPLWACIRKQIGAEVIRRSRGGGPLGPDGGRWLARRLLAGELSGEDALAVRVLLDCAGGEWSLAEMERRLALSRNRRVGTAPLQEGWGDRLAQSGEAFVLAEEMLERFGVASLAELEERLRGLGLLWPGQWQWLGQAGLGGAEPASRTLLEPEWTPAMRALIPFLERRSFVLAYGGRRPWLRRLVPGESAGLEGWTDGATYIAINRRLLEWPAGLVAWQRLAQLLLHEYCHESADRASHVHGVAFYRACHDRQAQAALFAERCALEWPQQRAALGLG